MPDMSPLTHAYFEAFVDQSFTVSAGERTLALRVTEVRLLPPPKRRTLTGKIVDAPAKRAPFSVYFRSVGDVGLGQGMYGMTPPDGGKPMNIFIVPLGFEDGGMIYEAIFT